MLNEAEIRQLATRYAEEEGVTFSEEDLTFIRLWTGGHPALLETTCRILGHADRQAGPRRHRRIRSFTAARPRCWRKT